MGRRDEEQEAMFTPEQELVLDHCSCVLGAVQMHGKGGFSS